MVIRTQGVKRMTERFEIFPQNVTKDGTLIIIQKGLKLYNISDVVDLLNAPHEENEQLKKELFESEVEYINSNYADNSVRRDQKINSLKEEFEERFGQVF